MSFLGDLLGDDGSGRTAGERAGNHLANTAKDTAVAALENQLAKDGNDRNNSVKRAGYALAAAGAAYILNKALGKDSQDIPEPWSNEQSPVDLSTQSYIRTPEHAYNTFFKPTTADNQKYLEAHPINSSLFLVDFVFNQQVVEGLQGSPLSGLFKTGFPMSTSFLLKEMDFPKVSFETAKINRYNRTIIRPKKVNYDPVNITFQDIYSPISGADDLRVSIMSVLKEYLSYYTNDVVRKEFNLHNGLSSDRDYFQFINSIDIYLFWGNGAKKLSLVNPFISTVSYSNLTYEDNSPLTVGTTVDYEYLEMSNMEISSDQFLEQASHLLNDVDSGFTPDQYASPTNLDKDALQPMDRDMFVDSQRRLGLDNPIATMAIRLAETEGLRKFGNNISSPDPIKRAVSRGAFNAVMDTTATATNAVGNAAKGLF